MRGRRLTNMNYVIYLHLEIIGLSGMFRRGNCHDKIIKTFA